MSAKINKNGKEYDLGFVPQSLYDDVEDLKDGKVDKSGDTMTGSLVVDGGDGGSGVNIGGRYRGNIYVVGNNTAYNTRIYNNGANELTEDRNLYLPNKSGTIALTSDIPIEYYEFTTASGETYPSCLDLINAGFLSSGRASILKINNQITVRVAGITTKSSQDWICCFKSAYRPVLSADEYFTYCLGDSIYKGFVTTSGYIYFKNLDTTHILSATITFNIA